MLRHHACKGQNSAKRLVEVLDARVGVPGVPLAIPAPPHVVVTQDSLLLEIADLAQT